MNLTRDHLTGLDKEALIELVLQLSERVSQLEAQVQTLQARLEQNSRNSSKPPSSDPPFSPAPPRNKKSGKKSGGQPGHRGEGLRRVASPDYVELHSPSHCGQCGFDLQEEPGKRAGSWQVFDLPADLRIEVTEHFRESKRCPWCQADNAGTLPGWVAETTPCQYGPRCRALGVYLSQQQHLSLERTQALFLDLFGTAPSEGTLVNWLQHASETLAPVEAAIGEALLSQPIVGADETPMRGAGWIHVLTDGAWTFYAAHPKRGREAMEAAGLLPRYGGVLMSDCLSSYAIYGGQRALCNAHLLRDLQAVAEAGQEWASRMARWLVTLKERVETNGAPLARSALANARRQWGRYLAQGARENERTYVAASARLLGRLLERREEYLRFASQAGVWFDNNQSERALRMVKLHQKVSGCFRSARGAQILCRVRGYLSTMAKQKQALFAALVSVMQGKPLLPPLLPNPN